MKENAIKISDLASNKKGTGLNLQVEKKKLNSIPTKSIFLTFNQCPFFKILSLANKFLQYYYQGTGIWSSHVC